MNTQLIPKFWTILQEGYNKKLFYSDLTAGIIVGIVALPMSIAFAIAAGVRPEQGLFTAIVAGFIISLLSGSRVQIGGPTGAFIVIIYGIVAQYGYDGLVVCTLMAGILLIIMGFARLGSVIQFIPYPVTVGFTAGIALIIFVSQLGDLFGITGISLPPDLPGKLSVLSHHLGGINPWSLTIALVSLLIIYFWPRVTHRIPGSIIAILLATTVVTLFHLPVETIGIRFGAIPSSLPAPHFPKITLAQIQNLFSPAISIALLAAIESLLSAVVADGMTGRRHRSNMELIAQGTANIFSVLFGGIPATGAIARTATNIKNGGQTPIAGIIHALTLLLIMLAFGKWAALIPMSVLAAILIIVAINMSEYQLFISIFKSPKSDIIVLLTTFLLTILVDLTVAIQAGVVLASLLFMRRMAGVSQAGFLKKSLEDCEDCFDDPHALANRDVPNGVEVFEIGGPFFFGAADKFKDALSQVESKPRVLILRMRNVPMMDATGMRALEDIHKKAVKDQTLLVLSGVHAQPLFAMQKNGLLNIFGEENIHGNIDDALNRAREFLGLPSEERSGPFVPTVKREKTHQ